MAIATNTQIGTLNFTPVDTNIVQYRLTVLQGTTTGSNGVVGVGFVGGMERIIPASSLIANANGTVTIPVLYGDVVSFVSSPEMLKNSAEIVLYSEDANGNQESRSVAVDKLADLTGGGVDEGGEGQDFDLNT